MQSRRRRCYAEGRDKIRIEDDVCKRDCIARYVKDGRYAP
jgi:hypothetical protein